MTKTIAIMAAGKGTRMLPLTKDIPKPMILLNGKPFLHYLLKNVKEAGYEDIIVIVGYLKEKIEEFLIKNKWDVRVIEQKEILGSGNAIQLLKEEVKEDFVVINGDNLFSANDLKNLADEEPTTMLSISVQDPEKYGVLVVSEDNLLKIIEKPQEFIGNQINVGAYHFNQEIFDVLEKIDKSERGEYEIVDALSMIAKHDKVKVLKIKDYWMDLGCKEDIPKLEDFLRNQDD
jgi:bifunctional UDP-N-acetylglucosamine pyrophosphorylase/glucosamine-1-phosphate N-acetyltransferase